MLRRHLATHLIDNTNPQSWAGRLRQARFERFRCLVETLAVGTGEVRVLDVGGAPPYWLNMVGFDALPVQITLLNLIPYPDDLHPRLRAAVGDARAMPQYADSSFDLVHSNSVLEHVGPWEAQQQVAREIRRVGRAYFVQTPNRAFPLEPHFLLPGFQFLPVAWRVWLARRFRPGWYRTRSLSAAIADARTIRLLSRAELAHLFPDGQIWGERLLGLTKSWVITRTAD